MRSRAGRATASEADTRDPGGVGFLAGYALSDAEVACTEHPVALGARLENRIAGALDVLVADNQDFTIIQLDQLILVGYEVIQIGVEIVFYRSGWPGRFVCCCIAHGLNLVNCPPVSFAWLC